MGSKRKSTSSSSSTSKGVGKPARKKSKISVTEKGAESKIDSGVDEELELDEISLQLKKERERALSILDSMLGSSTRVTDHGPVPADTDTGDTAEMRSETMSDIGDAESDKDSNESRAESSESDGEESDNTCTDEPVPENTSPTKSSASTDFKQLFSSSNEQEEGFRFLADDDASNSHSDNQDNKLASQPTNEQELQDETQDTENEPKYFFFHSASKTLNRLDHKNQFCRQKTWAELEEEWPARRTALKEGFRRSRRDAVRAGRKRKLVSKVLT